MCSRGRAAERRRSRRASAATSYSRAVKSSSPRGAGVGRATRARGSRRTAGEPRVTVNAHPSRRRPIGRGQQDAQAAHVDERELVEVEQRPVSPRSRSRRRRSVTRRGAVHVELTTQAHANPPVLGRLRHFQQRHLRRSTRVLVPVDGHAVGRGGDPRNFLSRKRAEATSEGARAPRRTPQAPIDNPAAAA